MKHSITLLLGFALFPLTGCGGDGGPALVKVTGTVTLNGKPYENASVEFMPDAGNQSGTIATDTTGPEGNYMLRVASGRTGVAPGKYTVKIVKAAPPATAGDDDPTPKNDPGQMLAESTTAGKKKTAKPTEEASGTFPAEVPAGGGVLDFDVKATGGK